MKQTRTCKPVLRVHVNFMSVHGSIFDTSAIKGASVSTRLCVLTVSQFQFRLLHFDQALTFGFKEFKMKIKVIWTKTNSGIKKVSMALDWKHKHLQLIYC